MNGEGAPGRAEEDLGYLRGDFVTGFDFGDFDGEFYPDISLGFLPVLPQAFFELPPILLPTSIETTAAEDSATPGPEALPTVVVDPEQGPLETVFEDAPGGIYQTNRAPTDWDWVYDQYVILNAPEGDVPFHDNIDWGTIAGTVVGGLLDPFGMGAAVATAFSPPGVVPSATAGVPNIPITTGITGGVNMQQAGACGPTGPKYGKICLATGVVTPLRRRRRRRLLTSSDIKDLSALKSIVGGAALQGAVIQAVRR